MTTAQLVSVNYERLQRQLDQAVERAGEKRSTVFYEWAIGKVLLNAKQTESSRLEQNSGDIALVLHAVNDVLGELKDNRLVPALTYDKLGRHVIILVLKP